MTYVMSDLHGMAGKYAMMLDTIGGLKEEDTLYVLGDMIDRGEEGDTIMLTMMGSANVIPLLGNHEALALPVLKAIRDGLPLEEIRRSRAFRLWMLNGGEPTLRGFSSRSTDLQRALIEYMGSFPLHTEVTAAGRWFHLSHSLPPYCPDYPVRFFPGGYLWGEPDYEVCYDPDFTFITGHTPTGFIEPAYKGRIWQGNGHIAVDCGASFEGGRLGCLCLDTMEEFYV